MKVERYGRGNSNGIGDRGVKSKTNVWDRVANSNVRKDQIDNCWQKKFQDIWRKQVRHMPRIFFLSGSGFIFLGITGGRNAVIRCRIVPTGAELCPQVQKIVLPSKKNLPLCITDKMWQILIISKDRLVVVVVVATQQGVCPSSLYLCNSWLVQIQID